MSTLQELLEDIDDSTPVEKTASAKRNDQQTESHTDEDVDNILMEAGVISKEDAVEKTAGAKEGGTKMLSLYDAVSAVLNEDQEVEKTAAAGNQETETEDEEMTFEKFAASEDVQNIVDGIGAAAGEFFNELYEERMEKIAAKAGIAPDDSLKDRGPATGMFGESGDPHVETNRPADSKSKIDTTPQYYDMDAHSNSLVGLCVKKKMLSRQMHGRS